MAAMMDVVVMMVAMMMMVKMQMMIVHLKKMRQIVDYWYYLLMMFWKVKQWKVVEDIQEVKTWSVKKKTHTHNCAFRNEKDKEIIYSRQRIFWLGLTYYWWRFFLHVNKIMHCRCFVLTRLYVCSDGGFSMWAWMEWRRFLIKWNKANINSSQRQTVSESGRVRVTWGVGYTLDVKPHRHNSFPFWSGVGSKFVVIVRMIISELSKGEEKNKQFSSPSVTLGCSWGWQVVNWCSRG